MSGKFWDLERRVATIFCDRLGSRPWGHLGCLLAVALAVPQPFLSRSWAENGGKLGLWAAVRPQLFMLFGINESESGSLVTLVTMVTQVS